MQPTDPSPRKWDHSPDPDQLDAVEATATVRMYAHLTGIDPDDIAWALACIEMNAPHLLRWVPVGNPVIATGEEYHPPGPVSRSGL